MLFNGARIKILTVKVGSNWVQCNKLNVTQKWDSKNNSEKKNPIRVLESRLPVCMTPSFCCAFVYQINKEFSNFPWGLNFTSACLQILFDHWLPISVIHVLSVQCVLSGETDSEVWPCLTVAEECSALNECVVHMRENMHWRILCMEQRRTTSFAFAWSFFLRQKREQFSTLRLKVYINFRKAWVYNVCSVPLGIWLWCGQHLVFLNSVVFLSRSGKKKKLSSQAAFLSTQKRRKIRTNIKTSLPLKKCVK